MAGDKNKLTEKQRQILEYLKQEILQRGFPPSVREICEAVSLRSTSSVHAHLETLERKGYIKRDATKPRAIEICDEGFHTGRLGAIQGIASEDTASQSEVAQIPLIGKVAAGEPILAVEIFPDAGRPSAKRRNVPFKGTGRKHGKCRYFRR